MSFLLSPRFWGFKASVTVPETIVLNDRIVNDLQILSEYTIKLQKELGGYVIRNSNGRLGVIGLQKGKSREVNVKPNEELQGQERYLGLVHFHPITDTFSIWDIGTFLANSQEWVSMVTGSNGDVNILIKTPSTKSIEIAEIPALEKWMKDKYGKDAQAHIPELADAYQFLYYKGKLAKKKLKLMNDAVKSSGNMSVDDLTAGIKGLDEIPDFDNEDVTKKGCP